MSNGEEEVFYSKKITKNDITNNYYFIDSNDLDGKEQENHFNQEIDGEL